MKPSRIKMKPSRMKPSRIKPSRIKPSRIKPSRIKPCRAYMIKMTPCRMIKITHKDIY